MEHEERVMAREKLDKEQRYFRIAARNVLRGEKTLMELAEQQKWMRRLGKAGR